MSTFMGKPVVESDSVNSLPKEITITDPTCINYSVANSFGEDFVCITGTRHVPILGDFEKFAATVYMSKSEFDEPSVREYYTSVIEKEIDHTIGIYRFIADRMGRLPLLYTGTRKERYKENRIYKYWKKLAQKRTTE